MADKLEDYDFFYPEVPECPAGFYKLARGNNDLTYWPNMVLRGLKCLHINFDKF